MKRMFVFIFCAFLIDISNVYAIDTSAECACLMIAETGEVLYSKNADTRHSMASTTKIMTGLIAIENEIEDETVTVSANAANQEGSSIYVDTGDEISGEDLLYGMLLNSGNDAACAIAEHISGSVESFSEVMTQKAHEIGAVNTSFKNPSGLDADGHYSTAEDMALICSYALENDKFKEVVSTKNSQINVGEDICYLKNHNKLLWDYEGCIGVKTGYTKKTGRCLVSAAERNGITLIAVTLGAPDDWNDHKKMLDFGFENTKRVSVIKKGEVLKSFLNDAYQFNAIASEDIFVTSSIDKTPVAEIVLHTIKAPTVNIVKGEKIGYAECVLENGSIKTFDLVSDCDVKIEKNINNKGKISNFFETFLKLLSKISQN